MKLEFEFYNRDTVLVARELLGKILVKDFGEYKLKGRIVEVEAYTGENDKASHTFGNRKTDRTKTMYMAGGHLYVYFIYGMYYLINVVTRDESRGEAVLIRGLEPLNNLDIISENRFSKKYNELSNYQKKNLTNGPGKLSMAFQIDKSEDGINLLEDKIYIEDDEFSDFEIRVSKRIGIDYAEEAINFPYRFYIKNNKFVSKK